MGSTSELTLQEKLTFLQREVKDKDFRISDDEIFIKISRLGWAEVKADYFKARVLDWLIKNEQEEIPNETLYIDGKKADVLEFLEVKGLSITSTVKLAERMNYDK